MITETVYVALREGEKPWLDLSTVAYTERAARENSQCDPLYHRREQREKHPLIKIVRCRLEEVG